MSARNNFLSEKAVHFNAKLSITFLRYMGLLKIRSTSPRLQRLHRAYGFLNAGLALTLGVIGLAKLADPEIDMVTATTSLAVTFAAINAYIKACWILSKSKELEAMERRLTQPLPLVSHNILDDAVGAVRVADRRANLLVRMILTLGLMVALGWDILPYIHNRITGDLSFQRITIHFSDITRFPGYDLESLLHVLIGTACAFVTLAIDSFAYCVFMYIILEFEVLNIELKYLQLNDNTKEENTKRCELSEKEVMQRLGLCVSRHSDIIKFAKDVESVFTLVLFMQFLVCTGILCLNGFQIILMDDVKGLLKILTFTPTVLADLFVFCWLGEEIRQQSVSVSQEVYGIAWYNFGVRLRRSLLFTITRAQRPVAFTAGGFYNISLDTFVQLMSTSYSMCALLLTMNEKQ